MLLDVLRVSFFHPVVEFPGDEILEQILNGELLFAGLEACQVALHEFLYLGVGFLSDILVDLLVVHGAVHVHF